MPTWLVKVCQGVLLSLVTKIVKQSLSLGVFPRSMKSALLNHLLKNPVLSVIFYTITDMFRKGSCFPAKQIFIQK